MELSNSTWVAVVGYGYWGSKHVRVLSTLPGVNVVVVDEDPARLAEAQRNFPSAIPARSLADVVDLVDGVVVATPPTTHAEIAAQALKWNKHTLVEKPLATSVRDAHELVETADRRGLQLMTGHTFVHNAAVHKLREIIRSGELGKIFYIDTARLNLGLYQHDVNVIWDLAPHDLSIISYLLDDTPGLVAAWAQHNVSGRHADVAHLRLEMASSAAAAYIHVSWLNPQKVRRVTVVGDRKMAIYNDILDEDRIRIYDSGVDLRNPGDPDHSYAMPVTYRTGEIVSPHVAFREPLLVQDQHFVDCIRTGARPRTSGEDGLRVVQALAAADLAQSTGGPVLIDTIAAQATGPKAVGADGRAREVPMRVVPPLAEKRDDVA
ncbi:Gfo/Idh/MocA family oxidoreductase [Saccharopolyspora sp. NPDC000359]|uniref:Gfo/Idh/MocA family protein n=1 Tax=Saccharopolyspora sp. NPDC000359 TaxID=3154251 RepID=UPI00331C7E5D